jgi:hypothetical protein
MENSVNRELNELRGDVQRLTTRFRELISDSSGMGPKKMLLGKRMLSFVKATLELLRHHPQAASPTLDVDELERHMNAALAMRVIESEASSLLESARQLRVIYGCQAMNRALEQYNYSKIKSAEKQETHAAIYEELRFFFRRYAGVASPVAAESV